ncbi:Guanylate cyclase soluble subunit beta-1 [Seminavis robusta]|uniref:guanylate cyclase n=1 Tax=Seminavis robusta TaxID=568900 RepID=A0A9N8EJM0_9STRA|nr:Guanylate cyclase soluble subunit beta-1 [Seminavis robusta]|eukprot:Sro1252_g256240.1 Guanylate cyclase soluble subunit beta-1 (527) ;mRNA; r:6985-8657
MLGWINDCVEKLVLAKFDLDAWHSIKEKAGCKVEDGGFYKLDPYPDQTTVDLVMAAVEVSGLSAEAILETFGAFFVQYVRDEGYDNLLRCQGSNLKDFMANINAMHQHLQDTFPNKMTMPQFWVEDDESGDGAIILHYHSKRGSLLAPVAKGVVCQVASDQFGYEIKMERLRTQGEEGAEQTSWKISTVDPDNLWKLTMRAECKQMNATYQAKQMKCPFTGMTTAPSQSANRRLSQTINTASVPSVIEVNEADIRRPRKRAKFSSNQPSSLPTSEHQYEDMFFDSKEIEEGDPVVKKAPSLENTSVTAPLSIEEELSSEPVSDSAIGLSGRVTRSLFPYHIMVDLDLKIAQVGNKMPTVMQLSEDDFVGRCISEFLVVTKPVGIQWSWKWLRLLEDQAFDVQTVEHSSERPALKFKTTVVHVTEGSSLAMLVLTPDANNLQELREMKMTFSDLPLHGAHRESILLREHLSSQINSAAKMEQLSHSLEQEKTLLESMLPAHAAEGLRQGKTVERGCTRMLHCSSVTL